MKIDVSKEELLMIIDELESVECEYGYDSERCALINKLSEVYNKPEQVSDWINETVSNIMNKRNEILDLFCKTFIATREWNSAEDIKNILNSCCLECKMSDGINPLTQTFTLKLKE